ncbi:DUF389 domain-containing protein [Thiohalomonas denitrificans]|uniref:Uncharacterized protein n=1 Tax=Thiohalomonas denitrificans TaxID=415747 RepID=A0A1G5PJB9_9GAMM|nr:DUF389 domain-containing protein [Thiohalomonas denitrificans]SCZ49597.1 protein of unknown function [Thiohalomonas denitrificans]
MSSGGRTEPSSAADLTVLPTPKDKLDTLVGVVAALALVPAVAAFGISLLSGEWQLALGGLLMTAGNGTLIVLGSIITLLLVRPDRDYA